MITIDEKRCTGCSACAQICPQKAILMRKNAEGFSFPAIDKTKCNNCKLCEKVCQIYIVPQKNDIKVFGCINKDEKVIETSLSGGVFFALAEHVIKNGGIVFGCEIDKDLNIKHSFSSNIEDCRKYCGSKYVQSEISDTYKTVMMFLKDNKKVLFTGTPCQIEGLKLFLSINSLEKSSNLFTVDVVCHGVPSSKVLKKYLSELEEKFNAKINKINFRNKKVSWKEYSMCIDIGENEQYCKSIKEDIYLKLFLSNICLRKSCYNCNIGGTRSVADISLADFWGVEYGDKKNYNSKGTSLVLINNENGRLFFNEVSSKLSVEEVDLNYAIRYNPSIIQPVQEHPNRKKFFKNIDKLTCEELGNKYFKLSIVRRMRNKFLKLLK